MSSHVLSIPALTTLTTLCCLTPLTAVAQIVPDNTLGSENSVVTPNVNIRGINSDRIDGGAVRGGNLFHSFQEFNVEAGRGAYFSNPDGIANILTRVTGENISNILGRLGVLGNANFFLINPAGIVFGPNARLDVGGSFFATTADGILFKNGFEFAVSNPEVPPLLTINMPLGLNIRSNPGTIVNQAQPQLVRFDNSPLRNDAGFLIPQGLNVPQNQTLALVGGDVIFDNGVALSPGSNIELGGLSEPGIVELNENGSLTFPSNIQRANIALSNESQINIRADDGGDININAGNFEISGSSIIRAGIDEFLGSLDAKEGTINIHAQDTVSLTEESNISNLIEEGAVGNGGVIEIITGNLFMSDGSQVSSFTSGQGDGGLVSVQATNSVELSGQDTALFGGTNPTAIGQGGNVIVNASSLILRENASIDTSTLGQGSAGNISIFAASSVELSNSNILSLIAEGAVGNGGVIEIITGNLFMSDGSQVSSFTSGQGDGGFVSIQATGSVELSGQDTALFGGTNPTAIGQGGNVTVNASSLILRENASINTSTLGQGNAGNIEINTTQLEILNGGLIGAVTSGQGNAGNITIQATESVQILNGSILSSVAENGIGNGGTIKINTAQLELLNGGQIAAGNAGQGNAGHVTIQASNSVQLISGDIFSNVTENTTGNAGQITIETPQLRMTDAAQVSASTDGEGNAGTIIAIAKAVRTQGVRHSQWHLVSNQTALIDDEFDSLTKTNSSQSC